MAIVTYFFRGNPLLPHRLLFPINSKGSFVCTFPQTGQPIPEKKPATYTHIKTKKGTIIGMGPFGERSDNAANHCPLLDFLVMVMVISRRSSLPVGVVRLHSTWRGSRVTYTLPAQCRAYSLLSLLSYSHIKRFVLLFVLLLFLRHRNSISVIYWW